MTQSCETVHLKPNLLPLVAIDVCVEVVIAVAVIVVVVVVIIAAIVAFVDIAVKLLSFSQSSLLS